MEQRKTRADLDDGVLDLDALFRLDLHVYRFSECSVYSIRMAQRGRDREWGEGGKEGQRRRAGGGISQPLGAAARVALFREAAAAARSGTPSTN